jgi:hypothetical protein
MSFPRQDTFSPQGFAAVPAVAAPAREFAWKDGTTILRWGFGENAGPVNNPGVLCADTKYIYMTSTSSPTLRISRATRVVDQPFTAPAGWTNTGQTAIGTDGTYLYVVGPGSDGNLWKAPIAGGTFTKVANHPALGNLSAAAGHGMCFDGVGNIYIPAANAGQTQFALFKINPVTGTVTQLGAITGTSFDSPTCDGTFIYYLNTFGGTAMNNIGQIKLDGTGQTAAWATPGGTNNFSQGCLVYEPFTTHLYFVNGTGTTLQWTSTPTPALGINNTQTSLGSVPASLCLLP